MFSNRVLHLYTDGALEIVKAGKNLRTCHDTSTHDRSATNGIAEQEIRNVLEGTRTLLEHSGLPTSYWPYASRCFCHHANIRMVEGDSAWNKRHKQGHFKGEIIPFGALIDFRPLKPILSMFPKFEKRSLPGIFLGYHLMSGERFYGDCAIRRTPARTSACVVFACRTCRFSILVSKAVISSWLRSAALKHKLSAVVLERELDRQLAPPQGCRLKLRSRFVPDPLLRPLSRS